MAKKKVQSIIRIDRIEKYADILLPVLLQIDAVYKTTFTIANGSCYILSTRSTTRKYRNFLQHALKWMT